MFYIFPLLLALVLLYACTGLAVALWRAARGGGGGIRRVLSWLAMCSGLGAITIYLFAYALYSGGFASNKACAHDGNFDERRISYTSFPLSTKCTRGPDAVVEIVPSWTNPAVYTLLLVAVASLVALSISGRFSRSR